MPEVLAYACDDERSVFEPRVIAIREPGPTEIFIDVKYAGICHSDIHTARGEWGPQKYPLTPGHEIAGVVAKVGSRVTLAGYVGVGDHVSITDDVRVGAKGGVSCNIREKGDWGGYPPVKAHRWRMQCAALEQLPEMMRDVKRLRKLLPETEGEES